MVNFTKLTAPTECTKAPSLNKHNFVFISEILGPPDPPPLKLYIFSVLAENGSQIGKKALALPSFQQNE